MMKDVFFSAMMVILVVALAAIIGPKGPSSPADPALGGANPRPEWPFLWLFALLSLSPAGAETFIILVFPVILIGALLFVPFFSNRGERAPSRRPVAVLSVIVIYTVLGVLTYQGIAAPWSPQMTAWSGDPIPTDLVRESTPLQLQGALVFQNKNCRNCHALEGIGGQRGPDLTTVGTRLTRDQLIDQVSNGTPGGGNMPAYGKQLNPAEMTTLAEFLVSLRPGQPRSSAADRARLDQRAGSAPLIVRRSHGSHARRIPSLLAIRSLALASLLLAGGIYVRGWLILRRRDLEAMAITDSLPPLWVA